MPSTPSAPPISTATSSGPTAILPARIGFSKSKGVGRVLSELICRVSGSPASHCWCLFYSRDFGLDMVVEAHSSGVRLVPYRTFRRTNHVVRVYQPSHVLDVAVRSVARELGDGYDYGGLVGMVPVVLLRRFGWRLRNPLASRHAWFCTEIVAKVLQKARYPGAHDLPAACYSPLDVLGLLERSGAARLEAATLPR